MANEWQYRARMKLIRHLLHNYRVWLSILFMLAFAMKALVPHGYMISSDSQTIMVKICNGAGDAEQVIEIPMNADTGSHDEGSDKTGEACSSGSVSQSTMTATDPLQLALALAFIMVAGLAVRTAMRRTHATRLRPPLRGPPAFL